jgi:hypothetical protein
MSDWHKNPDRVLGTVRGDDKLLLVADENPGDAGQPRDREDVSALGRVDDIDGIVLRMRHQNMPAAAVNCRVVESALPTSLGSPV